MEEADHQALDQEDREAEVEGQATMAQVVTTAPPEMPTDDAHYRLS